MKKYEGLFILDIAAGKMSEKEIVDRIQKAIEHAGGRVEKVQRMGTRPFARNVEDAFVRLLCELHFQAPPKAVAELDAKFHLETDVFRWLFTEPTPEMPVREPRSADEAGASWSASRRPWPRSTKCC